MTRPGLKRPVNDNWAYFRKGKIKEISLNWLTLQISDQGKVCYSLRAPCAGDSKGSRQKPMVGIEKLGLYFTVAMKIVTSHSEIVKKKKKKTRPT